MKKMAKRSQNITAGEALEKRGRGRPKTVGHRILLTLPPGTIEQIDAARAESEDRLDLIRAAIEREIKRRK